MSEVLILKCDICGRTGDYINPIEKFKIKRYKYRIGWERIDICSDCLRNFKKVAKGKE